MTISSFDPDTGEVLDRPPAVALAPPPRINLMPVNALVASIETTELWSAMIAAQQHMKSPRRTKTASLRGTSRGGREYDYSYKYAPIEEVARVVRDAAMPHNLWYQQGLVYRGGQQPFVRTVVYHSSGQWMATDYPIFAEDQRWQNFDAAVTRASRRSLMMAFGLTPEDDKEEITNEVEARVKPPRTQVRSRHAGAFSSSHPPDEIDGEDPAETVQKQLIEAGWRAADQGSAALERFAQISGLTQTQMTGPLFKRQMKYALTLDRERMQTGTSSSEPAE